MKEKIIFTIKLFVIFVIAAVEYFNITSCCKNINMFEPKTIPVIVISFSAVVVILFVGFLFSAAFAQYKSDREKKIYQAIMRPKLHEEYRLIESGTKKTEFPELPSEKFLREWEENKHAIIQAYKNGTYKG